LFVGVLLSEVSVPWVQSHQQVSDSLLLAFFAAALECCSFLYGVLDVTENMRGVALL
jgi:hypothetical protein